MILWDLCSKHSHNAPAGNLMCLAPFQLSLVHRDLVDFTPIIKLCDILMYGQNHLSNPLADLGHNWGWSPKSKSLAGLFLLDKVEILLPVGQSCRGPEE